MQTQSLRRVGNGPIGIVAIIIGLLLTLLIGYLIVNDRDGTPETATAPPLTSAIDDLVLPYNDLRQLIVLIAESGSAIDHLVLPFVDPYQPEAWATGRQSATDRTMWDAGDTAAELRDRFGLQVLEKTPWDYGDHELMDQQ